MPQGKSTSILEHCKASGLRLTGPRRVIAAVLDAATDHPDAEELHRRVAAMDPKIALSTVYRTLKLLEQSGILERHQFADGRARYENADHEHHDHLIDIKNDKVIEFTSPEIEALQARIAADLGYRIVGHRLQLFCEPLDPGPKSPGQNPPGKDA